MTLDGDVSSNVIDLKKSAAALVPATLQQEAEADDALVDKAFEDLSGILIKHFVNSMEEIGEYLIKTFFDDDIHKALEKKPTKEKSLNKLITRLRQNSDASPSRSWIYNSIKIVADKRYFAEKHIEEYARLQRSHRVYLTHVNDLDTKEKLVRETADKGLSVAKLKKRIKEEAADGYVFPSLSVIEKRKDDLEEWPIEKLEEFYAKTDNDIKALKDRLDKYKQKRAQLKALIDSRKRESSEE